MPNNKKSSSANTKKVKEKAKAQKNLNAENLEALQRLSAALKSLDDKGSTECDVDGDNPGLSLFHWRELDGEAMHAYKILNDGAELIKATSTKYTLMGKINLDDGSKFAEELRQGCELISTGALLVHQPTIGCARSTRKYVKYHARSTLAAVISLIESFVNLKALDANVGAQKTGVVWSACDDIISKLPKGNRASMRREMFTWVADCNETMQEFKEIVDLGAASGQNSIDGDSLGSGEQYSSDELEIAKACLAVIKCSRGILGLVLKACECAGEAAMTSKGEGCEESFKAVLQWISNIHELARVVGENVTDLGMLLYPPISLELSSTDSDQSDGEGEWLKTEIGEQISFQVNAIKKVGCYVHDHCIPGDVHIDIKMSDEVMELASKLLSAIDVRKAEAAKAIDDACTAKDKI
mmetsp:Transcript_2438/g.3480  ORF Transcript_2438/g.3480 Transcript_2438/m.3480 type:complete len:412 (-) Transcript_2438:36-1271(-)|eukprot:CAMPEP_0203674678 /NCGR_PEP_ID=MMETSP0090-20130426/16828_1 /ASSEMBLY_ACC=CAM_ASM_001088 /TAXON_ID=426623 /ORGANISM="Chaetoceros affinis, Strain CCMP159" /LENGTH=411 /DNA_ID=CAMNT_0050540619 /DNA_START=82 /DNA_END=1317 /DNA_ORIENTATION=+